MSQHLRTLERIAREEIPALQLDVQGSANPYQLKEVLARLINVVGYVVQDIVLDAMSQSQPRPAHSASVPTTVPAVRAVPRLPPAPPAPSASILPPLPSLSPASSPANPQPAYPGVPSDAIIRKGETNVVITASGTTVVGPSGQTATLPPGEVVPPELTSPTPPAPPPAPEGVAQHILPPGGAFTPDVAAALGNLSNNPPPDQPDK